MIISREEKLDLLRRLMWDYNINPEECLEALEGTRTKAGRPGDFYLTDGTALGRFHLGYRYPGKIPSGSINRILQQQNRLIKAERRTHE